MTSFEQACFVLIAASLVVGFVVAGVAFLIL
jgi:hypothetical protein